MDIDSILDKLLGLFEKKIDYLMKMGEREMSLKERTEERKLDIEYRKLEAKITDDKDKLTWEKEKTGMVLASNLSVEEARSAGLLSVAKENRYSAKDVADINASAHRYASDATKRGVEIKADADVLGAKWAALGPVMKAGESLEEYDKETGKLIKKMTPSPFAVKAGEETARSLIPDFNRAMAPAAPAPAAPSARDILVDTATLIKQTADDRAKSDPNFNRAAFLDAYGGDVKELVNILDQQTAGASAIPAATATTVAPSAIPAPTGFAPFRENAGLKLAPLANPPRNLVNELVPEATGNIPARTGVISTVMQGINEARARESRGRVEAPPEGGYVRPPSPNQLEFHNPFAGVMDRYGEKFKTDQAAQAEQKEKRKMQSEQPDLVECFRVKF